MDDRRGRLAENDETVEDRHEIVHRPEVQLHEEAVLPGNPKAVDDLGNLSGELGDLLKLAGGRPNPYDRGDRKPDRLRIDLRVIGGDHPGAFGPLGFSEGGGWSPDPVRPRRSEPRSISDRPPRDSR